MISRKAGWKTVLLSLGAMVLMGVAVLQAQEVNPKNYVREIMKAHDAKAYYSHGMVVADAKVLFGGGEVFEGTMIFDPALSVARLESVDGTVTVFDGEDAWVSPADAEFPRARFHVLTWPYFLAAPMKLDDPGTFHEYLGELTLRKEPVPAVKMTFGEGIGDAPDDWYVLYRNPVNHRLDAMAYIVTYGKSPEEAEEEPHAIVYNDYETVGGPVLSMDWKFYHWSRDKGIYGDPIGHVAVDEVQFRPFDASLFTKPENARKAGKP